MLAGGQQKQTPPVHSDVKTTFDLYPYSFWRSSGSEKSSHLGFLGSAWKHSKWKKKIIGNKNVINWNDIKILKKILTYSDNRKTR